MPHKWLTFIPFMGMVAPAAPKLSTSKIIEAIIIAGMSGAFTVSVMTIRLDERLIAFRDQQSIVIQQLRKDNEELRRIVDKFSDQLIDHLTARAATQIAR